MQVTLLRGYPLRAKQPKPPAPSSWGIGHTRLHTLCSSFAQ